MISESFIHELIQDKLAESNAFLVGLSVKPGNKIMVLIDKFEGVSVEDCIQLSRLIEHSLDREVEDFELEVSSPGLGQPFKVHQQYVKNLNRKVEVITLKGIKIKGSLKEVSDDGFVVEEEKMIKPEDKKKKELQIVNHPFKFEEVKSVKDIITF